jgi:hypothetical protein
MQAVQILTLVVFYLYLDVAGKFGLWRGKGGVKEPGRVV